MLDHEIGFRDRSDSRFDHDQSIFRIVELACGEKWDFIGQPFQLGQKSSFTSVKDPRFRAGTWEVIYAGLKMNREARILLKLAIRQERLADVEF